MTDNLTIELREAARSIQGNLGRCLYKRKDVDHMRKVSDLLFEAANTIESIGKGTLTAEQVRKVLLYHVPHERYCNWQLIADELNATLGDDDYERRMDELLCRLTNGKWSKSRSYSVDFMVSCIDEAYEDATLGSEQEIEFGNVLNEVADKWAIAQAEAEDCAKRCRLLEELVQDWEELYKYPDYGDHCRLKKRTRGLGIEMIDE